MTSKDGIPYKHGFVAIILAHGVSFAMLVYLALSGGTLINPALALLIGATTFLAATGASLLVLKKMRRHNARTIGLINQACSSFTGIDPLSGSETASIPNALEKMVEHYARSTRQIEEISRQVLHASSEIADNNRALAQRVENQGSHLEKTAANLEEVTNSTCQTAENAEQGERLAKKARKYADHGAEVVVEAISAMAELNEESRRISEIINVIDDIAFQTNLLSLNAAVEAARAGEQGKGFAVVANEVRNLAQRCAESANEIKTLIEGSLSRVERSTGLVNESGERLKDIVKAVSEVNDLMSEITIANKEQATGIQQTNDSISQLDQMNQQNVVMVEETAEASRFLKEIAQQLALSITRHEDTVAESTPAAKPVRTSSAEEAQRWDGPERRSASRPWSNRSPGDDQWSPIEDADVTTPRAINE